MSAALLTDKSRPLGERGQILIVTLAVAVASVFVIAAGPVSSARATAFCPQVTLGPNDQCHLPIEKAGDIHILSSYGFNRAHCTALLGYYGEQLDSWVCAAKEQYSWYFRPEWRPPAYYRGAIKNNNLSQSGVFSGAYY